MAECSCGAWSTTNHNVTCICQDTERLWFNPTKYRIPTSRIQDDLNLPRNISGVGLPIGDKIVGPHLGIDTST
jgi:hypothetical protein